MMAFIICQCKEVSDVSMSCFFYCVFHPPQLCARSHVSMENVWDQTSVYAPQGIKDLTVMKVEFNAQNHCQSYVSNFLTITCVLLHHLPQGFLSAA